MNDGNLFTLFRERNSLGDRVFIERPEGGGYSYAETIELSGRFANALGRFGVVPGDRVAVQVDKSAEALILYLAVLRAGAIYLPLNPAYTPEELRHFLSDARPALFICRPQDGAVLEPIAREAGVSEIRQLGDERCGSFYAAGLESPATFADVPRQTSDAAAILYTSGTTGRPKGVMLTHGNLASNAQTLAELWRFTREDVLLHALPIFHTHGLFVATNVTLFAGSSLILLPRFDPDEVLWVLPRCTVMMGVPTFYSRLLTHEHLDAAATGHMRLFISGSAPLSEQTHHEWSSRTGHAILERYGMTETNMNSSNPFDGDRIPGSVGFPLPGVDIRITDTVTGAPLAAGEIGMIELRGPNIFIGYWGNTQATAEAFGADGFFASGDLGRFDERGYLYIVGRNKDLIISGGLNIYPAEVEQAMDALPGVAESAAIGVPHHDLGEAVVAVIALHPGAALDSEQLLADLGRMIARYKVPRRLYVVDRLPRNAMGKIEKGRLREEFSDAFA